MKTTKNDQSNMKIYAVDYYIFKNTEEGEEGGLFMYTLYYKSNEIAEKDLLTKDEVYDKNGNFVGDVHSCYAPYELKLDEIMLE